MVRMKFLFSLALLACATLAMADAAGPAWQALSAEQRYILQRYEARWPNLDAATRAGLVARADALRAATAERAAAADDDDGDAEEGAVEGVKAKAGRSVEQSRPRRRSARLTTAEAVLSAHSSKLKRRLRETPGLSLAERRDVLARWPGLSSRERMELVERYATNPADSAELALQKALREGRLKPDDIQQGLRDGRIKPGDLSNALGAGQVSASDVRAALGSDRAAAADIETAARTGQAPSPGSTGAPRPAGDADTPVEAGAGGAPAPTPP